jgi:amino acid transporter
MKLGLRGLVLALYFMVSGGPFGLEELLAKVGFWGAVPMLLVTPLLWSLPTALMVGELAAALPESGGYYAWVKRALGPFWGFQEGWLSFAASLFDMAIYPTLFTSYLGRLWPPAAAHPVLVGVSFIVLCLLWNLRGLEALERGGSWLVLALLLPFAVLALINFVGPHPQAGDLTPLAPAKAKPTSDVLGALMIAMWNFMGWDNASTLAGEVRAPQKNYPRGILVALAFVVVTYMVPVLAAAATGADPSGWTTGSWIDHGQNTVGRTLGLSLCVAGMASPLGMFSALMASYARLPVALAEDGYLPRWITKRDARGAPYVALCICALLWTLTLGLSFERLVVLDIMLYGASLLLEFVSLVALRIREPSLPRPYRVPGGIWGAALLGVGPLALLGLSLARNREEKIGNMPALLLGALVMASGVVLYAIARHVKSQRAAT